MAIAVKRASKEFKKLKGDDSLPAGIAAVDMVDDGNVLEWRITLLGPVGTPWAGGKFKLLVHLSEDYPNQAPKFQFETKIWHPSVATDGKLCEGMTKDWCPTSCVKDILPEIMSLFVDPKGHDFLNEEAGKQVTDNEKAFQEKATKMTKEHAK